MKYIAASSLPLFPRPALARCLPFVLYLSFIAIDELLLLLGYSGAQLRWLYGVKVGCVALALAYFWRDYGELRNRDLRLAGAGLAVLVGIVVLLLWLNLGAGWMSIGNAAGFDPRSGGRLDWALVLVRIAGAALVVPLMEELFWRSFLLRWLDDKGFAALDPGAVSLRAVAISSVLFGFEHNLWLAGIVAGLAYALLYRWQRSLWAPIIAHAVTNGLLGVWVVATASWQYW